MTDRISGDLGSNAGPSGLARRQDVVGLPWSTVRQVHGDRVVVVDGPVRPGDETEADALVTSSAGLCLAVFGADCPLVGLASPEGVLGAAHAGWRGLTAGVLGATVEAMRALGATEVAACLGPCIHPECYEFGVDDLDQVAGRLGNSVRAVTASGRPALDLPGAVRASLAEEGVSIVTDIGGCTACGDGWFSYRGHQDVGRHALVVWREPA